MRESSVGEFLEQVAARVLAPGAGSVAAVQVASAAALVAKVARSSSAVAVLAAPELAGVIERADELRETLLREAAEMARATAAEHARLQLAASPSGDMRAACAAAATRLCRSAATVVRCADDVALSVSLLKSGVAPVMHLELEAAELAMRAGRRVAAAFVRLELAVADVDDAERAKLTHLLGDARESSQPSVS